MVSDLVCPRLCQTFLSLQIGSVRLKLVGAVASNQTIEGKGEKFMTVKTHMHLQVVREQEEEESSGQLHDFTGTRLIICTSLYIIHPSSYSRIRVS